MPSAACGGCARWRKGAQGWLRGTLSLRIGDRVDDRLGLLADQLDILVEHLRQDEQDLSQLREQSSRQTDQIRALAVDEERERLARELHDGVKQHLFSLSMTASALCARMEAGVDAELLEMAREVEKTSGTVQRTLTRLVADLRPTPLQVTRCIRVHFQARPRNICGGSQTEGGSKFRML